MKAAAGSRYEENVFVNCPFDETYRSLFEAIVFCIYACGFRARCALELDDSAPVRIEKICRIIGECQHGVHDDSRVQLDAATTLPRFNMPFELGLFLAARQYGHGKQRHKRCLILDSEPYRYRSFLSDIAGQDIKSHSDPPQKQFASRGIGCAMRPTETFRAGVRSGRIIWRSSQTCRAFFTRGV